MRAVFKKHLEELRSKFPDVVELILNQLYVDDLLGGADGSDAALAIPNAAKEMFAQIKIKLHKWLSYFPDVLKCFQEPHHEQAKNILSQVVSTDAGTKALGVRWDTLLRPNVPDRSIQTKTNRSDKRDMLKLSSRIVDPLGLISPIVLEMRMLHQQL